MATHLSILNRRIPWIGESGGLWPIVRGVTKHWTQLND